MQMMCEQSASDPRVEIVVKLHGDPATVTRYFPLGMMVCAYRLIDLKSGKIGMRCISTGLSPLDLGIGAMV